MAQDKKLDRVWDIVENVGICMLTTQFSGGLRARPLEARPDRTRDVISFVIDVRGGKDDEVEAAPGLCLTFIDDAEKAYLSITGRASVLNDAAKARAIWKKTDDAWWQGPDDPNVRVLCVRPEIAELWDGPASSQVARYEFAKAFATGEKPNLGENRKVTVEMK